MRIKPSTYTGKTALRDYSSHFHKVCVINGWETTKLQYLWVHLERVALFFAGELPSASNLSYENCAMGKRQDLELINSPLSSKPNSNNGSNAK